LIGQKHNCKVIQTRLIKIKENPSKDQSAVHKKCKKVL